MLVMLRNFCVFNDDLTTIINKSEAVKKAKKENPNPSDKEEKEPSEEEKEMKSKRKQIQEKLIKFATRIPVFMYLTDYRERCLKDVITQLEPGLFKKVTGLNVADFNMLCSLGVFNAPLMNDAIFKFKRYEDASLIYTGIDRHRKDEVGGWDTTIPKSQYERLFYNQQATMANDEMDTYTTTVKLPHNSLTDRKQVGNKPKVQTESVRPSVNPEKVSHLSAPQMSQAEMLFKARLDALSVNSHVHHKKFGKGSSCKNQQKREIHLYQIPFGRKEIHFSRCIHFWLPGNDMIACDMWLKNITGVAIM